jgi:very-long-chain (3R)-3-hydroxyacyl-CoA dehydratase
LTWARYSLFIITYPVGAACEWVLLLAALKLNALNCSFEYSLFLRLVLVVYPPLFTLMYMHVMAQRQRKLAKKKTA